jgi:four helix bundle protein
MNKTNNYKQLIVWQKSIDLTEFVYRLTSRFPKEEIYGLTSQIRRCSVSVPSNIAEGQARSSIPQFKHFLSIAKGSLAELETQFIVSERLKYIAKEDFELFQTHVNEVGKLLNGLINSLKD